jgi:phospholipid-binding lipoprotein MlaA
MPARPLRVLGLLVAAALLVGCATPGTRDPSDPWEGFNREVFAFNSDFDRVYLKPVARGYRAITPQVVDDGVTNFFANAGDPVVAINSVLQGKPAEGLNAFTRFVFNTTFGVLGIFDFAGAYMDLPKQNEDFGQTLAVWGVPDGPYLVVPFLGPGSLRDTPASFVDLYLEPLTYYDADEGLAWGLVAVRIVDTRADLLPLEAVVEEITFDPYLTLRDAYLQRRAFLVRDGAPPPQEDDPLLRELELLGQDG